MRRLAYIPARSGSKGIPKKNIRPLCGKPLIGRMIVMNADLSVDIDTLEEWELAGMKFWTVHS